MIGGRDLSGRVFLKTAAPGAVLRRDLPSVLRWSFLLFIGSLVIDVWHSAKLWGFLFFALYFFYHDPLFRKRSFAPITPVVAWFMIYVAVLALNGLFLSAEYLSAFFERLFSLVQSIVFVWVASDLLKNEKLAKKALLAYVIAAVIVAVGLVFSLPGFGVTGDVGSTRASAIGASGNWLSIVMAVAMVVMLGLWLNLAHKSFVQTVWMLSSMLVLSAAIVNISSRLGFLTAMAGVSVYLLPYWKNRWRISAVSIGIIAIAGLAYLASYSPVLSSRLHAFSEEGDVSGRDMIFEQALGMISERPLIGWQPIQFEYELGSRTAATYGIRSAFNICLHVLMEVGVVGAVPFLIGLWLCGQGAWRARNGNLGLLPLALFVAELAASMATNSMYHKTLWFVLAVSASVTGERKRQGMILARTPIKIAYDRLPGN